MTFKLYIFILREEVSIVSKGVNMYLRLISVSFLVFLFAENILAMDMTSKNAKNILAKALELQRARSYTATTQGGDRGVKLDIKIFQRLNRDGSVYYREDCKVAGKKKSSLKIKNQRGSFYITTLSPHSAIKYNYPKPNIWDSYYIYDQYADYTIENDTYNNIPCYKISKLVEFKKTYYNIYLKAVRERYEEMPKWGGRKSFQLGFPAKMVFYIGKDNNFVYSKSVYNPDGKLLITEALKNVKLNPSLSDSVFALPQKTMIQPVNSRQEEDAVLTQQFEEYAQKYKKRIREGLKRKKKIETFKPSFLERTVSNVKNSIFSNTSIISSILFWGAMLVILFVVVFKVKQKVQNNK